MDRMGRFAVALVVIMTGCSRRHLELGGRPCDNGQCLQGYVCHPVLNVCGRDQSADCAGGGLCPSEVATGDACSDSGAFIPCFDGGTGCDDGCRTCTAAGAWSECEGAACTPTNNGVEICDGADNDCDGTTDEEGAGGCLFFYRDADGDGSGETAGARCLCAAGGPHTTAIPGDCDDNDPDNWDACSTCADNDGDDRYAGCDAYGGHAGPDCDDANPNVWIACATCSDADHDEHFVGCDAYIDVLGPDCDDGHAGIWTGCEGCVDSDGDGFIAGCGSTYERDCNDDDPNAWSSCLTCVDADGDDWYEQCDRYLSKSGPDCDDADENVWNDCHLCVDADGDGWPVGCGVAAARDCNDDDTDVWASCTTCRDDDGDGYYVGCDRYTTRNGAPDCDDNPAICGVSCNPGRVELCNLIDHDCDGSPTQDCWSLSPSNLGSINACEAADVVVDTDISVDTTTLAFGDSSGVITSTRSQGGAPEIAVFAFRSLTIAAGKTITVAGARAAAFVTCGDLVVGGTISACASGATAGPGGYAGGREATNGGAGEAGQPEVQGGKQGGGYYVLGDNPRGGGGGGGNCGAGGSGGSVSAVAGGDGGAALAAGYEPIVPLRGGGGGASSNQFPDGAAAGQDGGGGGGAVELVAGRTLRVTGTVTACGAGGGGASTLPCSGAGGGAGGAILLEGFSVEVTATARLAANGGGGGGGDRVYDDAADPSGANGGIGTARADGGIGEDGGADGGGGGAGTTPTGLAGANSSSTYESDSGKGGGGGGGAGFIRINGVSRSVDPAAVISPSATGCYSQSPLSW